MANKPTYEELEQRIRESEHAESELERVKLALQESEELYRTLIEFSPLPILVTQEEKIVFANGAAARLFGTSHQDKIIGSSPKDWTHPVSAEHAYHRRREAIELGKALAPVELVIVRKDKSEAIVIANTTLISHHGSPALLSVFNDVTVERHATEALSKSEERLLKSNQILSGVLEHTHMMAVFLDVQFNFIWVNRAYADTCKHEPDFFPGKNHFNLYPHEENQAIFQRVVETGEPFFVAAKPFEFPNQPERGITYWDWSLIPVKDGRGEVAGLVFTLTEVTERVRAEEALRESKLLLDATGRMARVGGWELDAETQELSWTEETYHIHEVPLDYRPPLEEALNFYHPDDRERLSHAIQRALEHGEPYDLELRFITAHGNELWTRTICKPQIVDGRVVRLRGTFQDITDRRLANEALRESEQKFSSLVEQASEMLFLHDLKGNLVDVNLAAVVTTGYNREELTKMSVFDIDPDANDRDDMRKHWESLRLDDPPVVFEARHKRKDGSIYQAEVSVSKVALKDGDYILGLAHDITERKQAQEALKESEMKYRTFVEHTREGIYCLEMEPPLDTRLTVETQIDALYDSAYVTECNQAFAEMYGAKDRNDLIGMRLIELHGGRDHPVNREETRRFIVNGYNLRSENSYEEDVNGCGHWFSNTTVGIIERDWLRWMWGTQTDITELKHTLLELEWNARRNQLLSNTAARLLQSGDPQSLIQDLCRQVMDFLERQTFFNFLVDERMGRLRLNVCAGIPEEEIRNIAWLDYGTAVCGCVARDRQRMICGDILNSSDLNTQLVKSYGIQAYCCHPLIIEDRLIGTLSFGSRSRSSFSNRDIEFMESVSNLVAIAMNRIQTENALRESEEKFRLTFDSSPDAVNINRLKDGLYLDINHGFTELTGFTLEDVIGKTSEEIQIWNDLEDRRRLVKALEERGFCENLEARFCRKDGSLTTALMSARIISFQGEPHIISITRDISDRIRSEQAMREREEAHRAILKTAMDGFWLVDSNGRLIEVNETYCQMSQYSEKELLNMRISDLEAIINSDEIATHLKKTIELGQDRFETEHRRKDGSLFEVEISVQYNLSVGDRFFAFLRDISEQKRVISQLQQAQKMESIGNLAGGIAHDFNNILSPIMVHAEMAMMDLPDDSPIQNSLKQIYKSGERARDLVKQILAFARKREGTRAQIKVSLIVKEAIKFLRSTIPTTIDIQYHMDCSQDIVLGDPTELNQIIMNLCTNAAHAMEERGGVIEVILENENVYPDSGVRTHDLEPGPYLKLNLKDTGHGIEPRILDKIFEPYFTTKEIGKGTGMGLAIVHGIVRSYGGTIAVQSEVGKGTAFYVYLPLVEESTDVVETSGHPWQLPRGNERILFVDDEEATVNAVHIILERLGYGVTTRTSSIEALEAFRNNPLGFDLVITDMTMPNMTGKDLAMELMAIRPDIPVILFTGFSEQIGEKRAREIGIRAFVMKPIVMSQIANTIREILDQK